MIKEIKYDTDTIVINTTTNTFYSEEKRKEIMEDINERRKRR